MEEKKRYDVIVIGSGLGGLISALILAMEGKKVLVLEKNNQYGGNLQTFVRNKTIFDTGVHYIGGLAPGQNLYRYFSYLNIIDQLSLEQMDADGYDYISFGNQKIQYPHAQGYENFVKQLLVYFPEEKTALEQYVKTIREICNSFPLYNLAEGTGYDENKMSINAKAFLDGLTRNETLKAVLSGSGFLYAGTGETTPLYVHALIVNSYISSAWRCIKGGSQISKALVKQLRKYGADLYKHQRVTGFESDGNRIISCTTDKHTFYGNLFISNIDIKQTIDMVGAEKFKLPFVKRIKKLEVTPSVFSVHIVLKPETIPYFNYNIYHFNSENEVWNWQNPLNEQWPKMYVLTTNPVKHDQPFADSLTVMTYMDFDAVKQWEHTHNTVTDSNKRGNDYEDFKQKYTHKIMDALEKRFPEIREQILDVYVSTPLSYRDYIGNEKGNMYGFVKDSENYHRTVIASKTKMDNLFFTGQHVRMHGILGVTISAFFTCAEILGREYFLSKVQQKTAHV